MKDKVAALLAAARPAQFQPGSPIDGATRERELAAAFSAQPDKPGYRRPAGPHARHARPRPRPLTAFAVAALCVVLVAAGLWLAYPSRSKPANSSNSSPSPVPTTGHTKNNPAPPSTGTLLTADVATPLPVAQAQAGMPPYYVVADHDTPTVEVRSTTTGQLLSEVSLPAGADPKLSKIAGSTGGRFVIGLLVNLQAVFYLLKVSDHGLSAQLTPLPVPQIPGNKFVSAVALSPNGAKLAIALQYDSGNRGSVEIVTLATGTVRTWTTTRLGYPVQLSWTDHGRELGFFWMDQSSNPDQKPTGGLWLLDPRTPGGNLMSGRLVLPTVVGTDSVQSAMFSPDGRTIDASVLYVGTSQLRRGTIVGGIVSLSARTGRPLSTLHPQRAVHSGGRGQAGYFITPCLLIAADATGNHLLVNCGTFGRLDRARFTILPNSDPQANAAASW